MTNEEIIAGAAITIFGKCAVEKMLEDGMEIPLHTAQGWAKRGPYRVKEGESGMLCKLWKKRKGKDCSEDINSSDFYLCKSYLFSEEQMELLSE